MNEKSVELDSVEEAVAAVDEFSDEICALAVPMLSRTAAPRKAMRCIGEDQQKDDILQPLI
jgi:hypothetical protein